MIRGDDPTVRCSFGTCLQAATHRVFGRESWTGLCEGHAKLLESTGLRVEPLSRDDHPPAVAA